MKKNYLLLLSIAIGFFASCESDPEILVETIEVDNNEDNSGGQVIGSGGIFYIDDAQTWTNDRIWTMNGKVVVRSGGALTIEAGTIVKSETGLGVDATALVIAAGATININGTSDNPVIFTDVNDQIDYNDGIISPNRVPTDTGKWGGIIVLGNATVGQDGGSDNIEGIASGYNWTAYGGSNDADNSGSITYVSIRHSGTQLAGGDEIQGLTLGGIGNGTTINNVEVVGSNDDGIEIFGGSVDVDDVVIFAQRDDALDLDQGYKGTITNAVIELRPNSDNPFEIDGTEDSTGAIDGVFTINNVTVYGADNPESGKNNLGDWKSDATGLTNNVVYKNIAGLALKGIDDTTYAGQASSASLGNLNFNNFNFITSSPIADLFVNTSVSDYSTWAETRSTQADASGANESNLSWTLWHSVNN